MKRFLVFAGACYYPGGGWDDFKGDFETLFDARAAAPKYGEDWWHVVDTAGMRIVPDADDTSSNPQ